VSKQQKFSKDLTVGIVTALGIGVLSSLSGCVSGESVFDHVVKVFIKDTPPLPAASSRELDRFKTVYYQYAKPARDSRQLQHFEEAFRRVRASYVRQITDMNLIDSAIKGVRGLKAEPSSVEPPQVVEAALDSICVGVGCQRTDWAR